MNKYKVKLPRDLKFQYLKVAELVLNETAQIHCPDDIQRGHVRQHLAGLEAIIKYIRRRKKLIKQAHKAARRN